MPEEAPWLLQLETATVARLEPALSPLPVEALPDRKDWRFIHKVGQALVSFVELKPGAVIDASLSFQKMTVVYEVVLFARSLRDHTGLYYLIFKTLNSLLGWTPPIGSPFRLTRARNAGYADGAWAFSLVFETDYVLVPGLELEETAPPMTNIEFKHCREDCECRN